MNVVSQGINDTRLSSRRCTMKNGPLEVHLQIESDIRRDFTPHASDLNQQT